MSSLEAKKIAPATGTTVTLGAAGDTVEVSATALKSNTIKDAGGNTLFTSDGSGTLSSVNSALKGGLIFISSQTVTGAASIEFTSGIDSTYKEYVFMFTNCNPATDGANFQFQMGASYNTTITSTYFSAYHNEADTYSGLAYFNNEDQAQGTGYQIIIDRIGNESDQCGSGELHIFNPSSTTYVKQFYARHSVVLNDESSYCGFISGFLDTTTALTQIQFKMDSGNFDGTIAMYGTGK